MTDYIDISAAVHSRAGLGRYAAQLATALDAAAPDRFALFYNHGRHPQLPGPLQNLPRRHVSLGYKPWRSAVLLGQLARLGFDRLLPDATLFHATEHLLMPLRGIPTVLTIHDLIFHLFPAYHKKLNYHFLNFAVPLFCRRADAIIAVSEASKRDIVTHYHINPAKITVIYEAASPRFQPPSPAAVATARQRYGLPDQFLLHLGTIEPRKNLDRLLDALILLRRDHRHLAVVLAGATGWLYDDLLDRIESEGLTSAVHRLGWVPDDDLPAVIAAATLAVQPSLYEGFGLPLLEIMACGQAVAASDRASHPEVGGETAVYFDPTDPDAIVAAIDPLLADPDALAHRRALGPAHAARFSWPRAAAETLAVYDAVKQRLAAGHAPASS